jgi:hypothetical protein
MKDEIGKNEDRMERGKNQELREKKEISRNGVIEE